MQYVPLTDGKQYVPGIYKIVSACGKIYVGSASNIKTRYMTHRRDLQVSRHDNARLQNYYNKYGAESLTFFVLELCQKEDLLEREQHYIDTLEPFFNISKTASGNFGFKFWLGKKHSPETKLKISLSNRETYAKKPKKEKPKKLTYEENIERISNINKSPEGRKRCSELHKGNTYWLGRKHKPETIAARMGAGNWRARRVYCKELDKYFDTLREANKFFGLSRSAACNAMRRKGKIQGKYTIEYAD
jgi:group I intron endonuclease